jgi:hypothetical protein
MSLPLAITLIVVLDMGLLALLALVMAQPRKLTPHADPFAEASANTPALGARRRATRTLQQRPAATEPARPHAGSRAANRPLFVNS